MKTTLRNYATAAVLLLPVAGAFVAQPASAQERAHVAQPAIRSMALNSNAGLRPGATLRLQMYATPGARWSSVTLADGVRVALQERSPGNYTGTYTVRRGDRIDPRSQMMARAGYRERVVTSSIDFPPSFQALAMGGPPAVMAPNIERFVMAPHGRLEPGRELRFRLVGAPGGDAWLDIPGVIRGVDLQETRPGVYEGSYTIRRRDDMDAFDRAVATLQSGRERATARVEIRGGEFSYGYGRGGEDWNR